VIFAGFSGAHQFCRVGAHAFLGMYCGTNRDVPAYTLMAGQPAEPRGINSEGLRRRGFTPEEIRHIKNAYRIVYRRGLNLADAVREIEALVPAQPELRLFLESLRESERGLVR
jgi:UDP-N-acetylglucosamine acyltransferase